MENNHQNPVTDNVGAGVNSKSLQKKIKKVAILVLYSICGLVSIAYAILIFLAMLNMS